MQQTRLSGYERKQLAARITADIDAYCVAAYGEGFRDHLGASTIGNPCLRALVYSFRHMFLEQFSGQMLRLFNRGHKEEFRFVEWLKGIGANVAEYGEGGKQFRMSDHAGHYGGSLDGQLVLPERYSLDILFVLEMKTHNQNSYNRLVKSGVKTSKPMHYIQMCSYGEAYERHYGIYIAINKNDDNIYVEVVDLDFDVGKKHRAKALKTITAESLPPKIAASPAYDTCKFCSFVGVCHLGNPVNVNCRSCTNAMPVENGGWFCKHWNALIPKEAIPQACGHWKEFT